MGIIKREEDKNAVMVDSFNMSEGVISDLREQNLHKSGIMLEQEQRIKQLGMLNKRQHVAELNFKAQMAALGQQLRDLGVELENEKARAARVSAELLESREMLIEEDVDKSASYSSVTRVLEDEKR